MTIINIRGTSGSGKSTLIHRYLKEHLHEPLMDTLSDWKKPKIIAYKTIVGLHNDFIVGRYETQCGGCDAMSYKGSHDDIERLVRFGAENCANTFFEGLTISSTLTRWQRVSDDFPGKFVWVFMDTPVEECHRRILARNGGREPKVDAKGLADYNKKYNGCMKHYESLKTAGERVVMLSSDEAGYQKLLELLDV